MNLKDQTNQNVGNSVPQSETDERINALLVINERLNILEKQNRLLVRIILITSGFLLLVISLGAATYNSESPNKITTKELQIVDDHGNTRIELSMLFDNPKMIFYDNNGKINAELGSRRGEPELTFCDRYGDIRLSLKLLNDEPGLLFIDKKEIRAYLSLINEEPSLNLYDRNGALRATFSIFHDKPGLCFWDENGKISSEVK